jgi:hypothetical protein
MPETITTPDFEQIAKQILASGGLYDDFMLTLSIVEQLRLVWNARGAADLAAFDALSSLSRDTRQMVRDEFERDLRGLDR